MAAEWMAAGTTLGGFAEEDLVAVVRLDDMGEGEGWVGGIRVAPALRRQGVGKELMVQTLTSARGQGIRTIRMFIEEENQASRALAAASGFHEVMVLAHLAGTLTPRASAPIVVRLTQAPSKPLVDMRWIRDMHGFTSPTTREPFRLAVATEVRLREEALAGSLYEEKSGGALFALALPRRVTWADGPIRAFVPLDGPLDSALSGAAEVARNDGSRLDLFLPLERSAIRTAEEFGMERGALWGRTILLYEGETR